MKIIESCIDLTSLIKKTQVYKITWGLNFDRVDDGSYDLLRRLIVSKIKSIVEKVIL